MIDFLVQPTETNGVKYNDMVLGPNKEFLTTTAISQKVLLTFANWLGDWFYNLKFGVDYPDLKKFQNIIEVNLKVQSILLNIKGVVSITSFSSNFNAQNRVYSFTVQYTTTDNIRNTLIMEG